jgi:predicted transcriptional regulator
MDEQAAMSRRERQIMDIVYARGKATATEVVGAMPDPPTRTTVRTMLRILEEKGHLRHTRRGREYVYRPVRPRRRAGQSALRRMLATFFDGSLGQAVAAHLADPDAELSADELERLEGLIRRARRKGGSQ